MVLEIQPSLLPVEERLAQLEKNVSKIVDLLSQAPREIVTREKAGFKKWLGDIGAKLKGWRTAIVHTIVGVPAALALFVDSVLKTDIRPLLEKFMTVPNVLAFLAALSLIGLLLRRVTTGPMGSKD